MASEIVGELNSNTQWYCHQCDQEITPSLPDYTCSRCSGGFVEQLGNPGSSYANSESNLSEVSMDTLEDSTSGESNGREDISRRPMRRGVRRTHIQVHRIPIQSIGGQSNLQTFLDQLMVRLTGGANRGVGGLNIQVAPLLLTDGLDNIITMLMNQADGAGPPPAQKDQIDALPSVFVVQEQVDKNLQCHVCMEDFQLQEVVRSLPCRHMYHGDCIVPWLELHGTCPICRQTIDRVSKGEVSTDPTGNESI